MNDSCLASPLACLSIGPGVVTQCLVRYLSMEPPRALLPIVQNIHNGGLIFFFCPDSGFFRIPPPSPLLPG